jgi:hypothetical protein
MHAPMMRAHLPPMASSSPPVLLQPEADTPRKPTDDDQPELPPAAAETAPLFAAAPHAHATQVSVSPAAVAVSPAKTAATTAAARAKAQAASDARFRWLIVVGTLLIILWLVSSYNENHWTGPGIVLTSDVQQIARRTGLCQAETHFPMCSSG